MKIELPNTPNILHPQEDNCDHAQSIEMVPLSRQTLTIVDGMNASSTGR